MKPAKFWECGVRWREFSGREKRLTLKQKIFRTSEARDKFVEKLVDKGNFYEIDSYLN